MNAHYGTLPAGFVKDHVFVLLVACDFSADAADRLRAVYSSARALLRRALRPPY